MEFEHQQDVLSLEREAQFISLAMTIAALPDTEAAALREIMQEVRARLEEAEHEPLDDRRTELIHEADGLLAGLADAMMVHRASVK